MSRKLIKKEVGPIRHNHIYNVPEDQAGQFIEDCLKLDHKIRIEKLNCKKSFLREKSELTLEEARNLVLNSAVKNFSFILRRGFGIDLDLNKKHWEFCASNMLNGEENFIWIEVEEEDGYKLVEKYNLINNENS
jgi:hypothetical protein